MDGLSSLLQTFSDLMTPLIKFLLWMFPFKIYRVTPGQAGIILTLSTPRRKNAIVGPGIVLAGPFEEVRVHQVEGLYVDLDEQAFQTKDGTIATGNAAMRFHVCDPVKAFLHTVNLEAMVKGVGMDSYRDFCRTEDYEDMVAKRQPVKLVRSINDALEDLGVVVDHFILTDLRPHEMAMARDALMAVAKESPLFAAQLAATMPFIEALKRPTYVHHEVVHTSEPKPVEGGA